MIGSAISIRARELSCRTCGLDQAGEAHLDAIFSGNAKDTPAQAQETRVRKATGQLPHLLRYPAHRIDAHYIRFEFICVAAKDQEALSIGQTTGAAAGAG